MKNVALLRFASEILNYYQDIEDALHIEPAYGFSPDQVRTIQLDHIQDINEKLSKAINKILPR